MVCVLYEYWVTVAFFHCTLRDHILCNFDWLYVPAGLHFDKGNLF